MFNALQTIINMAMQDVTKRPPAPAPPLPLSPRYGVYHSRFVQQVSAAHSRHHELDMVGTAVAAHVYD